MLRYYGGWVAENIYYLGCSGVINVNDELRIGGISGIEKEYDYMKGYYEKFPTTHVGSLKSVYHIREFEIEKLKLVPLRV